MPKIKSLVLIFSTVLLPVLLTGSASAQCTWMEGLSAVRAFNDVNDNNWQLPWDPGHDPAWAAHYCSLGLHCPLNGRADPPANDPAADRRPGVNTAISGDTCPSLYDIDCCHDDCLSIGHCCGPDVYRRVHGPACCSPNR